MKAAVERGDAEELAELMRQDLGFDVNMRDLFQYSLLHYACREGDCSPVVPLLLAHPDIDVNVKDQYGCTPFYFACSNGCTSSVRELLKDSRVEMNEPNNSGQTPLYRAAFNGYIDVVKWWIVSEREIDLGTPGNGQTDAIAGAKEEEWWMDLPMKNAKKEIATLLERFKGDVTQTRHMMRMELGLLDDLAAKLFALVVFVSDGLLHVNDTTSSPAARLFSIASQLPLELQMVLCFRQIGSAKEMISGRESEVAFKELARKLW